MAENGSPKSFSDKIYKLCTSSETVSSLLAAEPTLAPGDAWHKLYGHHVGKLSSSHSADNVGKGAVTEEDLNRAARCGKWGPTKPGELFLRVGYFR